MWWYFNWMSDVNWSTIVISLVISRRYSSRRHTLCVTQYGWIMLQHFCNNSSLWHSYAKRQYSLSVSSWHVLILNIILWSSGLHCYDDILHLCPLGIDFTLISLWNLWWCSSSTSSWYLFYFSRNGPPVDLMIYRQPIFELPSGLGPSGLSKHWCLSFQFPTSRQ